ncbi:MAG: hypothetical protein ACT4ON_16240 [Bacteroidota bacterium]
MITVLTVNLLTGYITDYIIHYKVDIDPYKFTAIAMLGLVFILVPAYSYLNDRVEILIARTLLSGSNSFGKILGLFISFGIIFSILFAIYLKEWFHISLITVIKNKLF